MSFQKIREFSHTLTFRLTLWYAGIFMVSTLLLILLFYHSIAAHILQNLDSQLADEISEFRSILREGGMAEVKQYLTIEVESESEDTFFRLVSIADDRELALTANFPLTGKHSLEGFSSGLGNNTPNRFKTITCPYHPHTLRIVTGSIGEGLALQVGTSFGDDEKVLALFRQLAFFVSFPLLFLAAAIGWFMAGRALKDMEQVTLTAEKIAQGDYSQRVRLKRSTAEVEKLADTFNLMLDRIQALIKGMREVTDNIAHDLRSPLARIRGKAEMTLISTNADGSDSDLAVSTIEECDDLIDMINTMLDITEAEAGLEKTRPETVAVNHLIQSACELFEPLARENDVQLTALLPNTLLYIPGDRHRLQRLVSNLIENGIKYNRPGGSVSVTVEENEKWLYIRFVDTGLGIDKTEFEHIFDRFYRCDTSRFEPGLGLGLSLARAIARSAGGDITVESTVNEGSRFIVRLPL